MSNKKYLDLTGVGNLINNVFSKFITKTEHAKEIDRLGDNINRVNDKADAAQDWCQTIEDDITEYIKSLSVSGKVITYAKGDGTTGTITTQDTNTTNTTGSTNTSSKIFLVGATSQAASPVTYSHDTAYVGTDGCLYSNSTRVVSEVTQSTEPTIQKTGDYWIIEG